MNVGRLNAHYTRLPQPWGRPLRAERGLTIRSYLDLAGRPVATRKGPALVLRLVGCHAVAVGWLQAHFDPVVTHAPTAEQQEAAL